MKRQASATWVARFGRFLALNLLLGAIFLALVAAPKAAGAPGRVPARAAVRVSTTLVINEIDYDQSGVDSAEFVEIKNVGAIPLDLSLYTLQLVNGNTGGAVVYQTIPLPATVLAAGGYFVICANAVTVTPCDLDVNPNTDWVQNGAPDAVAVMLGDVVVDTVSYEGNTGAPYTEGSGLGLEDLSGVALAGIARFPDGVDSDQNNVDLGLHCITPGAANVADNSNCGGGVTPTPSLTPSPTATPPLTPTITATPGPAGQLVINEVDYDQAGVDSAALIALHSWLPNDSASADAASVRSSSNSSSRTRPICACSPLRLRTLLHICFSAWLAKSTPYRCCSDGY